MAKETFAQAHPMIGEFVTSGLSVGTGVILTNPVGEGSPSCRPTLGSWRVL